MFQFSDTLSILGQYRLFAERIRPHFVLSWHDMWMYFPSSLVVWVVFWPCDFDPLLFVEGNASFHACA